MWFPKAKSRFVLEAEGTNDTQNSTRAMQAACVHRDRRGFQLTTAGG